MHSKKKNGDAWEKLRPHSARAWPPFSSIRAHGNGRDVTFHFFAEVHQGDGIFEEDQRLFFHLISSSTSTIWAAVSCVSVASDLNVFSVWSRPRWNRRNMSQVSTNQRRVFPFSSSLSVVFHLHFIVFSKFWLLFYDFCFDLSLSNLFLFFSLFFLSLSFFF